MIGGLRVGHRPRQKKTNDRRSFSNDRKSSDDRRSFGRQEAVGRQEAACTPAPFLFVTRDSVQLNPACEYWLDTQAYTAALQAAYRHYRRRNGQGWLDIRPLKQALALYQGQFLNQLYLSGSDLFDEWASLKREEYNRQAVEALGLLVEYHERRGEYPLARRAIARIIELAPWEETAQAQMMRLLAVEGQWSAAQNQYASLRRNLREQLDVEPTQATTALFSQIRSAAARNAPSAPRVNAARHNLPEMPTPFIGRDNELCQISARLADPECRLLNLLGPGGSGKTRLALEAAHEQIGIPADGVFFIPLVSVSAEEHLPLAIGEALGLVFSEQSEPGAQLLDYLRKKQILFVLDNYEHLLRTPDNGEWTINDREPTNGQSSSRNQQAERRRAGGQLQEVTSLLTEILQQAPGVMLLVTSRQRLNLQEECVYPVEGMTYPTASGAAVDGRVDALEGQETFDALALFIRRAHQMGGSLVWDGANRCAIIRICQLLDGLPLGIELAAAATWKYTCDEIARRIADDLSLLTATASNVTPRHYSLQAAFDVSWQLLTNTEQQVFCRLSIFRNGFEAQAAETVGAGAANGNFSNHLSALLDKSLLRRSAHGRQEVVYGRQEVVYGRQEVVYGQQEVVYGRYEMHEVIRQYAAKKLAEMPADAEGRQAAAETQAQHAHYYAGLLASQAHAVRPNACLKNNASRQSELSFQQVETSQAAALQTIHQESENIRCAWTWLVENQCTKEIKRGADSLYQYFNICSRFAEGMELFRQTTQALEKHAVDELVFGMSLARLGALAYRARQHETALAALERSQEIFRRLDEPGELAFCLILLGGLHLRKKAYETALACAQESLALYRQLSDRWGEAYALYLLGLVKVRQAHFEAAREMLMRPLPSAAASMTSTA